MCNEKRVDQLQQYFYAHQSISYLEAVLVLAELLAVLRAAVLCLAELLVVVLVLVELLVVDRVLVELLEVLLG